MITASRTAVLGALLLILYGLLFVGVGLRVSFHAATAEVQPTPSMAEPRRSFIGSASCAHCHQLEFGEWQSSQHAAAMQEASDKTVLGRFDGETFNHNGVLTTFHKQNDKFWITTEGSDGKLADFEIRYTFGIWPLQQYLVELEKGRLQAFGVAWDARTKDQGGQRWFHLYPDRTLTPRDPMHWTGIDQNWNFQCAFCHSTNLKKNYDSVSGRFQTSWSEINVGCEACHGPASDHVAWASRAGEWSRFDNPSKGFAKSLDERKDVTWPMSKSGTATRSGARKTSKEIEVCAACHARRHQFSDDAKHTRRLLDAFRPSLILPGLFSPDGQQRDEVYTYAAFLQSRMHAAGVTCSDCHNPHTEKLRAPGNAVCAQCHAPVSFDTPAHHHHAQGSKGAECAACHMPTTTYMLIDPRHDHSIRIPRPDQTYLLGVPNACNQCHQDKTSRWASDAITSWHPAPKTGYQTFAAAFDLADRGAPGAQLALTQVAEDRSQPSVVRASAIARLGRYLSPRSLAAVAQGLHDADASVRMAAVGALANADPQVRLALLPPLLSDETRVVRIDAARALAGQPERQLKPDDHTLFEAALNEYIAAQLFNAERPESHFNLGTLFLVQGRFDQSEAALSKAIEIDPTFLPATISLAELRRQRGEESSAEETLRIALKDNPKAPSLLHALGLSLVRQRRMPEALDRLSEAARLAPDEARFSYVSGVALHDSGKSAEGVEVLEAALSRHPYDRDILYALASYNAQAGQFVSALQHVQLLSELEPENPQFARLLATIKGLAR